eukprot:CAMPEP_0172575666 /NCGR_PEP_ID=MMETSP1067-20121228/137328_1 /TAXON_ID=265564 ORGANISM="Thalassiosira punctigera, Strain Tpunct2005C2" /NCGR_SAMPLE_ID=MMETSP1067 /ASSEMBLY_ACC=CAM_ASM_000444 /LENGTH=340 /DNA_ID=CAMNT_0013368317 /DNA_START=131 /DNA_END=1153 /DNA_ORIENTATION=-
MAAARSTVDVLLERESRQCDVHGTPSPSRLNAAWRHKVVGWYFTLIAALRRQHAAAAEGGEGNDANPFNRQSVHVTASLLDNYLMSLPAEKALRYKHDRPAYQLLATTCLLLGMRLAQHDQIKAAKQREAEREAADSADQPHGLKRAKTHKQNMNEAAAPSITPPVTTHVAIPNAATILRISAAPKSISEQHILSMVREMTGSRAFPRSKVVTSLDFVQALSASNTRVNEDCSIALGLTDVEEASRLADAALRNVAFSGSRPSVIASAAITLALMRSSSISLCMSSIREKVQQSIYGDEIDSALQAFIMQAESNLLGSIRVRAPPSRPVVTAHLIPLEDE